MKILDRSIEWLVAIAVVNITTLNAFRALMENLESHFINSLLNYSMLLLMGLLFLYQKRHYGIKAYYRGFWVFYLLYCSYIFIYMTLFLRYPLEDMIKIPPSIFIYFYNFVISIGFLICAPTIYHKFDPKKFLIISLLVCTIPSALFVQYVGVDLIQAGIDEDDEEFLPTLTITYANVPILVFAVVLFKKLFKRKWISMIISSIAIATVIYVLLAYGKRGPMLWAIVNAVACFFISSVHLKRYFAILFLFVFAFFLFMDPIIENLKEVVPTTGQRIEDSIKEGDTDGRFDLKDAKHSTYLIGIENFSRSPIWGYYFRLVTDYQHFRGHYPHNIFIEVLMTMGLLGFVPFMAFLFKAYRKCRKTFIKSYTTNQISFLILFLCVFLQLQTTQTIVFKHDFWLFLYMLCCLDIYPRLKDKRLVQFNRG